MFSTLLQFLVCLLENFIPIIYLSWFFFLLLNRLQGLLELCTFYNSDQVNAKNFKSYRKCKKLTRTPKQFSLVLLIFLIKLWNQGKSWTDEITHQVKALPLISRTRVCSLIIVWWKVVERENYSLTSKQGICILFYD